MAHTIAVTVTLILELEEGQPRTNRAIEDAVQADLTRTGQTLYAVHSPGALSTHNDSTYRCTTVDIVSSRTTKD